MNTRIRDALLCALFGAFLLGMLGGLLFGRDQKFSEKEKRYLAERPALKLKTLFSGEYGQDVEDWAADHLPGRDFLVGLNARAERALGLQVTKEIYIGGDGRLFERPSAYDPAVLEKNRAAVSAFAETVGKPVDVMLVPSAGYLMQDQISNLSDPYEDDKILENAFPQENGLIRPINLLSVLAASPTPEAFFYRTDHHWTSLGAYEAYRLYCTEKGKTPLPPERYEIERVEGFYGTTYTRARFWALPSEPLELWNGPGRFRVSFSEKDGVYDQLFFRERLKETDKYPVWLDGNHPLVTIENLNPEAEGSLLVIRDSYANCLGCFLADSWKTVTLADLRYFKDSVSALCAERQFDDILLVYSVRNYMTDSNLSWLD